METKHQDASSVKLLTVDEVAERLRRSPLTVRYWIARHQIGCVRIGRAVLVPEEVVANLIARGFVPPTEGCEL